MAKRQKAASPEPGELRDLVVGALDVAFPDVQVLDRDLEVGDGRCADLVAIDGEGHLLLVVFARDDDGTLLTIVDALAFARRNRPALLSHLDSPLVRAERPPVVVVVGEALSEPLLARLASIDRESLACLELRIVSSGRGRQAYLVPIELGSSRSSPEGPATWPPSCVDWSPTCAR